MDNLFSFYFELGFDHILDWNGYDHIAYVVALCAVFSLRNWSRVLVLVTAFTLGHSLTLALVGLDILQLNPTQKSIVETLIPLTIIATALINIYNTKKSNSPQTFRFTYLLTALFGLIHGLGFSTFFRSSMMPDQGKTDLIKQLVAFNLGVEAGQIVVVFCVLLLSFLVLNILKVKEVIWINLVSSIAIIIAIYLLMS